MGGDAGEACARYISHCTGDRGDRAGDLMPPGDLPARPGAAVSSEDRCTAPTTDLGLCVGPTGWKRLGPHERGRLWPFLPTNFLPG